MKKIITLALPLLFLGLITLQANALITPPEVITPIEVERVKDVCFIIMRGNHRTLLFSLHYVHLSPDAQELCLDHQVFDAAGGPASSRLVEYLGTVETGGSIGWFSGPWPAGYSLRFYIMFEDTPIFDGWVIIPRVRGPP